MKSFTISKTYGTFGFLAALAVMLLSVFLWGTCAKARAGSFHYGDYQEFLSLYVVPQKQIQGITLNVVDYDAIQKDRKATDSLYESVLRQFAAFDPDTLQGREEGIAFWINAYNIGAIKMIMDHYPVESIRSTAINWLKNPWNKKIMPAGGATYSLGSIEHDILIAKYQESLIHFAIVCASLSCPDLIPRPYEAGQLQRQLERQARQFLRNKKKGLDIRRDRGEVFFSKIFTFDRKTFPDGASDAIPLITPYLDNEGDAAYLRSGDYEIKYLDYNWDLNALRNAR
jgi:hypothetical protein